MRISKDERDYQNLYRGNIFPTEKYGIDNRKIKRLTKLINGSFDDLKALLPKNCITLVEQFKELSTDLSVQYYEEFFTEGFKLGFKLAAEVFVD